MPIRVVIRAWCSMFKTCALKNTEAIGSVGRSSRNYRFDSKHVIRPLLALWYKKYDARVCVHANEKRI